jgi:hypothetical protein
MDKACTLNHSPLHFLTPRQSLNDDCKKINRELYADLYRYAPDKDEWRKFSSPTSPGPRSAHQVVPSPAGGGKLWLFGGEFCTCSPPLPAQSKTTILN